MPSKVRLAAAALLREIDAGLQPSEKTIKQIRDALEPSATTKNQNIVLDALKKYGPCRLADLDLPTLNQRQLRSIARTLLDSKQIHIVSSTIGMGKPSRVLAFGPKPEGMQRKINGKTVALNHASKVAVRKADMLAKGEPVEVQPRRDLAASWF